MLFLQLTSEARYLMGCDMSDTASQFVVLIKQGVANFTVDVYLRNFKHLRLSQVTGGPHLQLFFIYLRFI
jgi:hypothetical protein